MGWLKNKFGKEDKQQAPFELVDDATFREKVLSEEKPVMLFLWSEACPHCRKMAPNALRVLQRHEGRIVGFQANAHQVPRIAQAVGLRGVPATVFFHRGKVVEFVAGFRPEDYLHEVIETHFAPTE